MAINAHDRYSQIMSDVEDLINGTALCICMLPKTHPLTSTLIRPHSSSIGQTPDAIKAEAAGAVSGILLHPLTATGCLPVARSETLHQLSPLCCAFVQ